MEDRLSSPTLSRSSLSLREWRQRCSRSLGARKALGSKFSRGNLTIFWDLIQRPFTNWKRFKWTIYTSGHMSDAVSKLISRENIKCYQHASFHIKHSESAPDQYGRQPPEVQLLGGQSVGLALGAVVEFVLSQLLLAGESLQTAVQADGLSLSSPRLLHAAVLLHNLQGEERDA